MRAAKRLVVGTRQPLICHLCQHRRCTGLHGIDGDLTSAADEAFSTSTQIATTKTSMSAVVDAGTIAIGDAKDAEANGDEPPNGKSSDELITEYREKITVLCDRVR